ncbi:2-amino-4-hydroxy-6-hydroxymethyldihydropteridine diphosphokinase [Deltaproteobacteria bacterium]|nr:2-amino-4-hydroxy-6-hydroxymethyldihydropteridine diphosphokinase [Deltaproteobacteria bacterium]
MNAVIGLGASLGDRATTLETAVRLLHAWPGLEVRRTSRVYASAPAGGVAGQPFLNAAVLVACAISADALAGALRQIEVRLGRRPSRRWADRIVDLDLLWIEGFRLRSAGLTVPHPRLRERDFALIPLVEVAPSAVEPRSHTRYADLPLARGRLPAVGTLPQRNG